MKESGGRCVAVVCPYDAATQEAVCRAAAEGIARVALVGEAARISRLDELLAFSGRVTLVPATTPEEAASVAVRMVRQGEADVVMKGLLNTDTLLHAILDKACGLLPPGRVLTHVMAAELPGFGRLLFASDVAVIPQPTLDQRWAILGYGAAVCRAFGIGHPRMALLHYSEKVSERVPLTLDYRELIRRADAGGLGDVTVDGPLDLRAHSTSRASASRASIRPSAARPISCTSPTSKPATCSTKPLRSSVAPRWPACWPGRRVLSCSVRAATAPATSISA